MILLLSQDQEPFEDIFLYLGCSKYNCFMCSHFLKAYGKLAMRGCYGRFFKPWTLLQAPALATGQPGRIAKAVIQLQKDLKNGLKWGIQKKSGTCKDIGGWWKYRLHCKPFWLWEKKKGVEPNENSSRERKSCWEVQKPRISWEQCPSSCMEKFMHLV